MFDFLVLGARIRLSGALLGFVGALMVVGILYQVLDFIVRKLILFKRSEAEQDQHILVKIMNTLCVLLALGVIVLGVLALIG
ncbi:hypothetical protein [Isobaculum melis]|uniref:Uncharacterized protein n=1 Tax=Isobaculum melis TaxID=142588 RepID=A0A1H9TDU0_9LACT|nr:hypothetical protein [Isobaculum melis]SER95278.1 hypothetical protein SAMN04488559_11272 [Isobaculum melis]